LAFFLNMDPVSSRWPIDFNADPVTVAHELIGITLLFAGVGGIIVETEAYDMGDPASHSFGGKTLRNAVMFGPAGYAYVYRSYGIHWCLNFVCRGIEEGAAVLIRALEPTQGVVLMQQRRGTTNLRSLCAGPGCLTQALGITGGSNSAPLHEPPFEFKAPLSPIPETALVTGARIGITRALDRPWRVGLKGSAFLSRKFAR
jgi:DNA-3-methyladenine glycosylase